MSDTRKFFQNGLLLTAAALFMRTVGLLLNAFVTRTVGAEGIGLYTLITTVYGFALTFATSGISLTVTRLVAGAMEQGGPPRAVGVLRAALLYALAFGGSATAVLFIFAPEFGGGMLSDIRTVQSLRVLSLSLLPCALGSVFSGYFVGVRRVGKSSMVGLCSQGVKILLTLCLIGRAAALGVEAACLLLCALTTLTEVLSAFLGGLLFLAARPSCGAGQSPSREMRPVFGMAFPLAISAYIRSALLTLEHVLIPQRLSAGGEHRAQALASYGTLHGMAVPMVLYPMALLSSFCSLLVPEYAALKAAGDRARMERITEKAYHATLTYAVGCSVLMLLFSEELGYTVYHSAVAGRFIAVLAPVIPIMYLDHVTDSILKGIGEHVYSMWVNITDSLLSVVLVWFLLPPLGTFGYALVIMLMEGYNYFLSALRLRARMRVRLSLLRSLLMPLAAALLSGLLSKRLFFFNGALTTPLCLILKLVFAVCMFVALLFLSGLLYEWHAQGRIARGSRVVPSPDGSLVP